MSKILLKTKHAELVAILNNSQAAKDFYALLPLKLSMNDYMGTEKIGDLPRQLSTDGSPVGYQASKGDLTYYAPWGNLAIFYKDFAYASGLVSLGRAEGDVSCLFQTATTTLNIKPLA